jgi:O-antigen ligase
VSAVAGESVGALLGRLWRDPAAWITTADVFVILLAFSLPWSTSLVAIFAAAALISMAPFFDADAFLQSLKRPISIAPVALFVLAAAGTLWSDASWGARFYAVGPAVKLLMLPILFYHFERSTRGTQVLVAFLVSCVVLMAVSWVVAFHPDLTLKSAGAYHRGIFVKNYIAQSQEFTLCAVALAYPVISLLRAKRNWIAALLIAISLSFFVNMAFVVVSRTALVTVPIMLAVFALLHLKWRANAMIFCAATVLAALAWVTSPQLRQTTETFSKEYESYKGSNVATSIGLRLEYWQKSLRFFAESPLFGHGTGSTRALFEQAAVGQVGAAAEIVGNPHNQTLNVAVQWGLIGIVVLYAMWLMHLLLFRGEDLAAWIGLLVVVQNVFTSLFNSHIFDFHEGWMYVLGVGVAGGMVLKAQRETSAEIRTVES